MTLNLPPDVQEDLDAHLDAVDAALIRGAKPRRERQDVLDALTDQVAEMMSQATREAAPTQHDLAAVLKQLDPPQAYESPSTRVEPAKPASAPKNLDPLAIWALSLCALGSLIPWGVGMTNERYLLLALLVGLVAVVVGTVLGIASICRIRETPAQRYGYPIAFFAVVAVPTVMLSLGPTPITARWIAIEKIAIRQHEYERRDWIFQHAEVKNGDWDAMAQTVDIPERLAPLPQPWILRHKVAALLVPLIVMSTILLWVNWKLYHRFKPAPAT